MRGSLVFTFSLFLFSSSCALSPVADTKLGRVSGKVLKTLNDVEYYGFMGIPFAKPPVKDLRFLAPQPPEPWTGLLATTKIKPACVQNNHNIRKGSPLGIYGSEDCLYLDVFSPNVNKKQPVLVFLYNEYLKNSYNKTKDYAPDFFIEENLVVVTISHRLSVFGFLSFEDNVLEGNSGLKDIVASLKWIKDNIRAFGGDPEKVTLMGSMGGGAAVDLLLQTNAKSLFHGAIIQGGSSWSSLYLQENPRERAIKFTESLQLPSLSNQRTLVDLSDTSVEALLNKEHDALPQDYFKEEQKMLLPFGPIIEKNAEGLLTAYPEDSELSLDMPLMIGFNSAEGIDAALQYLLEPRYISFVEKDFPLQMPIRTNFKFHPMDDEFYIAIDRIKTFYFPEGERIMIKNIPQYVNYLSDVVTSYAVDRTAKAYANVSSKPIYYYHFDYESPLNENKNSLLSISTYIEVPGTAPGDELCYLFKCPRLTKEYKKDTEYTTVQNKLIRLWSNFAKYGNPTPESDDILQGLKWEPYNENEQNYLNMGNKMEIRTDLLKDRFDFWDKSLKEWSDQAVNGIISHNKLNKDEL